ncbi:MAG: tRNA (guanine-N7)-methyltransferase [Planctomycetaceae bacterium]|nr:tRNA (guanine-N7)-methyltransferase [Planctomycetaceae bacterium]
MKPDPSSNRRTIEREFGVPIAGQILSPEQWTKTALKQLPEGHLDWQALFGRTAPVVLDLGCGNARYTIGSAVWRPGHDHLATDILPVVIRYATRRGNQRGLTNVRFAVIGGRELLADHVSSGTVTEIHCYHPQPFYDAAQVSKRLITPEFLALVHKALVPGGLFFLQTDNPGYWTYMRQVAPVFFDFEEHPGRWPDAPKGRTRREIIALRQGLPVFRGFGKAKLNLSEDEALRLAQALPPPTFDADRRLRQLDALERE